MAHETCAIDNQNVSLPSFFLPGLLYFVILPSEEAKKMAATAIVVGKVHPRGNVGKRAV
jgi:hypothetical protein